jgi:hypothetical protein
MVTPQTEDLLRHLDENLDNLIDLLESMKLEPVKDLNK